MCMMWLSLPYDVTGSLQVVDPTELTLNPASLSGTGAAASGEGGDGKRTFQCRPPTTAAVAG